MKESIQQDCEYLAKKMYYPIISCKKIIGFVNTRRSNARDNDMTLEDCEKMNEKGFCATISGGVIVGFAKTGV